MLQIKNTMSLSKTKIIKKTLIFIIVIQISGLTIFAQTNKQFDGSELWFTNKKAAIDNPIVVPTSICIQETSATFSIIESEITEGLKSIFNKNISITKKKGQGCLFIGTSKQKEILDLLGR